MQGKTNVSGDNIHLVSCPLGKDTILYVLSKNKTLVLAAASQIWKTVAKGACSMTMYQEKVNHPWWKCIDKGKQNNMSTFEI